MEEKFKVAPQTFAAHDTTEHGSIIGQHSPGSTGSGVGSKKSTLLDAKRLQNVGTFFSCLSNQSSISAITKRKLAMDARAIMTAVHQLDLNAISAEKVDILMRILPTEEERKIFEDKEEDETLGDEVCFLSFL